MADGGDSAELCGIEGEEHEAATIGQINRFARIINIYHGKPIKTELRQLRDSMDEHIKQDEAIHNQIRGAKYALYAIAGVVAFLVPLALKIIETLNILMQTKP